MEYTIAGACSAPDLQITEARRALELLHGDSSLIEARVFIPNGSRDVPHRMFTDDAASLAEWVPYLEENGAKSYIVLNPIKPGTFPVSGGFTKGFGATDDVIERRKWMFFDMDPERPAGMSATAAQKRAAYERALEVRAYLLSRGIPKMIFADSGNGYHLIVRVDLPNDADAYSLVSRVLQGVGNMFPAEGEHPVKIDQTVSNAARLIKFYGTYARKGEGTPEAPHRISYLIDVPEVIRPVSVEVLETVAAEKAAPPKVRPAPAPRGGAKGKSKSSTHIHPFPQVLDLAEWIRDYGVPIASTRQARMAGENVTIYNFSHCPLNLHDMGDQGGVWQFASGGIVFRCYHDSCRDFHTQTARGLNAWHMVRDIYESRGKFRGYIT